MFNLLEKAHDKGLIAKWFAWIEAITLTSALLVVGHKYELLPVSILGYISCFLIWISAFYTLLNIAIKLLNKTSLPVFVKKCIGVPFALFMPTGVLIVIGISIYGFIKAS